jgi:D-tyrosyl-tRNA(Tyr) deacylase
MRALVQRVSQAKVVVDGVTSGEIGAGLLVFVGVGRQDGEDQAIYLSRKIANLRIFPNDEGKMDRSVMDIAGEVLIVSQFTLYGDTRKGNRPSYAEAASPEHARKLYEFFTEACRNIGLSAKTGVFQAHMEVSLLNDGPVTLLLHSEP